MSNGNSWTKSFFIGIWTVLNVSRKVFFNLLFIFIFGALLIAIFKDDGKIVVPQGGALVLSLKGNLVIQTRSVDPFEEFMQEALDQQPENPEVLLQDVLFTIENAKQDNRIKALVLDLQGMGSAGLDKLQQIATALDNFKESEKPIYAIGDYYTQNQYYLASHANHVYMNPMGGMMLDGYGRYRLYYKEALEKLKASTHVFKVGTYKSAIEPFIRNDMSDEAKEANQAWLDALWSQYKADVANARGFSVDNFDDRIEGFLTKFEQAEGDFATYALQNGWVDALKSRQEVIDELAGLVGQNDNKMGFKSIHYKNYLKVIKSPMQSLNNGDSNVGVVVAKGEILNGTQKPGAIGGDSTARLLRKARLDDSIKAVVLHVDSPGGSAFASEIIRKEIENLKAAGKPVVASMSTYAASGGYWISASADQIWAAPSSITGSIGVFGMFTTFENSLDYIGVNTDGVGTTDFGGIGITRALDPRVGNLIQLSIEKTYDQFISLVANERNISKESVDQIAQGRVWIGETAKELGLVDELGHLEDAVKAAAQLANLDTYDTKYVQRSLSPKELFWKEFFGQASVWMAKTQIDNSDSHLIALVKQLVSEFTAISKLNDPKGTYVLCLECQI